MPIYLVRIQNIFPQNFSQWKSCAYVDNQEILTRLKRVRVSVAECRVAIYSVGISAWKTCRG